MAEDVDHDFHLTLILNKLHGRSERLAIKAPAYGDRRKRMLEDIAVLTGGQAVIKESSALTQRSAQRCSGRIKSVKVTKETTTNVGGAGSKEAIDERPDQG